MSLKDGDPSAATDHHRKVETISPPVLDLSLDVLEGRRSISGNRSSSQSRNSFLFRFLTCPSISFKDSAPVAASDHPRKVERVFPLVLDLSLNLFEGLPSVCSKRSSSLSRNIFSFSSAHVDQFAERMDIDHWQLVMI